MKQLIGAAATNMLARIAIPATRLMAWALMFCLVVGGLAASELSAQEEAKAAEGPPLKIAIFVSKNANACKGEGNVTAVTRFATLAQERINTAGGIAGRPLQVEIFEDNSADAEAVARVRAFRQDPDAIAAIGFSSRDRAALALLNLRVDNKDAAGNAQAQIPFIMDAALDLANIARPNVFSLTPSPSRVLAPLLAKFVDGAGYGNIAVVRHSDGGTDTGMASALAEKLTKARLSSVHTVSTDGLLGRGEKGKPALAAVASELQAGRPDLVVIDAPTGQTGALIPQLDIPADAAAAQPAWRPAILLTHGLTDLPLELSLAENLMFALTWDNLPELFNSKLRNLIASDEPDDWIFSCQPDGVGVHPDPFNYRNLAAINLGTRYADMVSLVANAGSRAVANSRTSLVRSTITAGLQRNYQPGRRAFKGIFRNWSFDRETRSVARTPFIVIQPPELGRPQLSQQQFVRQQSGDLRQIETMYLDVDMIRLHNINDNDKTFFAEFYVSVRSPDKDKTRQLDRVEFTNAYLDPRTPNGRQLTITTLHDGSDSDAYPPNMQMYKIAGRFFFDPELSGYPFDKQKFSIDLQPKKSDAPFIIQPPPVSLRDMDLVSDGWRPQDQFVGYAADFVPVVDAFLHQPGIIPFFKASFVWTMKRETTDYFLRVVVPLAFILIVAYLSIFIPQSHLEAIVTIQITALLSAVALYLSLPQLDSDTATISDRIFVFDYMMVSVMIVISILRINTRIQKLRWLDGILSFLHITVIPGLVAFMAYWVYSASTAKF